VGFRTAELVREPARDGKGTTFAWRLNGVLLYTRGANVIPYDVFQAEGRVGRAQYEAALGSATAAHMNMVWAWDGLRPSHRTPISPRLTSGAGLGGRLLPRRCLLRRRGRARAAGLAGHDTIAPSSPRPTLTSSPSPRPAGGHVRVRDLPGLASPRLASPRLASPRLASPRRARDVIIVVSSAPLLCHLIIIIIAITITTVIIMMSPHAIVIIMMSCHLISPSWWHQVWPAFAASVTDEIVQQTRRLSAHPSIVLWCGNNEAEQEHMDAAAWAQYSALAYDVIIDTLKNVTRGATELWPSSPSNGFQTAWSNPSDPTRGDVHRYVYTGDCTDSSKYGAMPRFQSEFGFPSFPGEAELTPWASEPSVDLNTHSRFHVARQVMTLSCHDRHPIPPHPTPPRGVKQSTFCMVHRKTMITMGSPYFV
jgi:hypothetical protein